MTEKYFNSITNTEKTQQRRWYTQYARIQNSGEKILQKLKDLNQQFADIWIRFGKKEAIPL